MAIANSSGAHTLVQQTPIGTLYSHMTQALRDDVRYRLRRASSRLESDSFADGKLAALSWLDAVDKTDIASIRNEAKFLFHRAAERGFGRALV